MRNLFSRMLLNRALISCILRICSQSSLCWALSATTEVIAPHPVHASAYRIPGSAVMVGFLSPLTIDWLRSSRARSGCLYGPMGTVGFLIFAMTRLSTGSRILTS